MRVWMRCLATVGLLAGGIMSCGEKTQVPVPADGGAASDSEAHDPNCVQLDWDCLKWPPGCRVASVDATGVPATFVVSKVYLGDTDRNGIASADAWRSYGYDIDGIVSPKASALNCQPPAGSDAARVITDGIDGTDNSFGANVVPALLQAVPDLGNRLNAMIASGELSMLIHIDHTGDGACDVAPAQAFFGGDYYGSYHSSPRWNGTDAWPIQCEMLTTCLPQGTPGLADNPPQLQFPASYVADGVWVDGAKADFDLAMSFAGIPVTWTLPRAIVTTRVPSVGSPATDGIVSGVVRPDDLIALLRLVRGALAPELCDEQKFAAIADAIGKSADIMADGTNEGGVTCTGISVGIGFNAAAAELGPVLNAHTAAVDPCAAAAR